MPCQPLNAGQFSIPPPGPGSPGFGNFAVSLPPLNIPFPPLPLQDLLALINKLAFFKLPIGQLAPSYNTHWMKDLMDGIHSILEKFIPFLMLYKFFLPILKLILCIIEILCALNNPFAVISAVINLFVNCIPEFLNLFPFLALIIMIISLILLIIALIEYLIQIIILLIELILRNILILVNAAARLDEESVLVIIIKIGDLLCILQNLFALFSAILIIIQLIESLLQLAFNVPPCNNGTGSSCCGPTTCPAFIKDNAQNGITSSTGNFLYYPEFGIDSGLTLPAGFPPLVAVKQPESWQFYDPDLIAPNQVFTNIQNAFDLPSGTHIVFFPSGTNYTSTTDPGSVPYTVDFSIFYDPTLYGNPSPYATKGPRIIKISKAIVQNVPTVGVATYNLSSGNLTYVAPFNGTLNLIGGTVTEEDGTPIQNSQGGPATIDEIFHVPINTLIAGNSQILYQNLTYTFNINTAVLYGAALVTAGCIPEVSAAKDFIATTIGAQFNANGAALSQLVLPDVAGAQECVLNAVNTYTQSISIESTTVFQNTVLNCLNNLNNQCATALTQAVSAGFDQYTSVFALDTDIQFTTGVITVTVTLNESSGNVITDNLPASTASSLASQITGTATFGTVSSFTYDGYSVFKATISATQPGNGTIKVAFNNNYISVFNNPSDITQPRSVTVTEVPYTFVQATPLTGQPRRDAGDVARDGTNDLGG
jgi:hypothetical protein